MLCGRECGSSGRSLARAGWTGHVASGTGGGLDRFLVRGSREVPSIRFARGSAVRRGHREPSVPKLSRLPCRQCTGRRRWCRPPGPGLQLLPAGALQGATAPCVLVDEIIPDAVACQAVELGLQVFVVAACLADPCVNVGYGDQKLIFAQGPLCFVRFVYFDHVQVNTGHYPVSSHSLFYCLIPRPHKHCPASFTYRPPILRAYCLLLL